MQIRYRITLLYTTIVTIIVLLLCSSVYYFSVQNRTRQFYGRLIRKSISTADLLWKYKMSHDLVTKINQTSQSALLHKSIFVYDSTFRSFFTYHDRNTQIPAISPGMLSQVRKRSSFLFRIEDKEAVAMRYNVNRQTYYIVTVAYDGERADWLPRLRLILTVSFVASLCIVLISGYIFSWGLVRSISDLTQKINRISSEQFSQRLSTGREEDELQQLGATINNLMDRLQSSFDTQRRFIDNASHELSTPLSSIGSQIDVALQRERDTEAYKNVLRSIYEDVRRLGILVRSLLEIAKISGSVKGLELAPVRIDELLMRLPAAMKKVNEHYETRLVISSQSEDEADLTVPGNEELLFSAVRNIVINACKFSSDHTAIVELRLAGGLVMISVKDKGPGISPAEQEAVFRPFYRSPDTSSEVSGSGLGLPLANQIIKLYGGSITVESTPGSGSTFTIMLRTEAAHRKEA